MSQRERREERKSSAARRRAETHSSGFQTSSIRLPEGLSFFEVKAGVFKLDILPYKVGEGNPFADPGELYYERTFFVWNRIGVDENTYCCLSKTFKKPDPIQEWKNMQARVPQADAKFLENLKPKERQLFLVSESNNPGVKLWDVSHHLFGKLLDKRIKNSDEAEGWDWFFLGTREGFTLRVEFEEKSQAGFKWIEAIAIDFVSRREDLPSALVNHGICLDDLLIEKTYEELGQIFLGNDFTPENLETASPVMGTRTSKKADEKKQQEEKPAPKDETRRETRREEPRQEKKPEPPISDAARNEPTAKAYGIARGDTVYYQGKKCNVMRVSGDGTSLMLEDVESDDVIHAISPADVSKTPPKQETARSTSREEAKQETTAPAKPSAASNDDSWDFE